LLFSYQEQRDILFEYMKTINNIKQIRMLSAEIVKLDKKIIEISKMSPYMQSSFVLYRVHVFESKINSL
jgi:hypothetical protein